MIVVAVAFAGAQIIAMQVPTLGQQVLSLFVAVTTLVPALALFVVGIERDAEPRRQRNLHVEPVGHHLHR